MILSTRSPEPSSTCLQEWIDAEFGCDSGAGALIAISLRQSDYDPDAAAALLAAARGESGEGWPERRLAVLLLENQLLRPVASDSVEIAALLSAIGVPEGTAILPRLARLKRAHNGILRP